METHLTDCPGRVGHLRPRKVRRQKFETGFNLGAAFPCLLQEINIGVHT